MDLLVLTRVFPPFGFGGLSFHLSHLYDEIASRGHDVTILAGKCGKLKADKSTPTPDSENVTVKPVEFWYREGYYVLYPLALYQKLEEIDVSSYDVALTHTQIPYDLDIPVIAKHHDCAREARPQNRKTLPLHMKLGESLLNLLRIPIDKIAINKADHIQFNSELNRTTWQQYYDIPGETSVVHNGVDLDTFYPRDSDNDQRQMDSEYLLFVGKKQKLLKSNVLNFIQESSYELRVAGVDKVNNSDVRALGRLNQETLAKVYSNAVATVHTPQFDAFGNIVLESLACGTPVVTNGSCGASEIIDERCGLVTEDIKEGVAHVRDLDSEDCVNRAREHTWSRVADETLEIINNIK